jgi:predicted cupin superfamily sugar epimerase
MFTAEDIIYRYGLQPHPEGGYFKETYRSDEKIKKEALGESYSGDRNCSTCIYFLLTSDKFSAFHRIKQDEIWHFYEGAPLRIHMITEDGEYSEVVVGRYLEAGEEPQYVVKGGVWFAVEVLEDNSFSFVGCTVSPGFDFQDFEMPTRQFLLDKFPKLEHIITSFTTSNA